MILLFSFLICAAATVFGIVPLKIKWQWKAIIFVLTFITSFKFHLLLLFCGKNFFAPDLPKWLMISWSGLFAVLVFFTFFISAYSVIMKILKFAKVTAGKYFSRGIWYSIFLALSITFSVFGIYNALSVPEVREYTIFFENLPDELDNMKIAHLSDIHVDLFMTSERIAEIVRRTNSTKPDMIALTGDFVDGRANVYKEKLADFKLLKAPLGVYGVPGNHEYYSGYAEWMETLEKLNITMLQNNSVVIEEKSLVIGGTTDPAAEKRQMPLPDVEKSFAGTPEGFFKILLAHQPRLAPEASKNKVDLQLAGHTHGGMLFGLNMIVAATNYGYVSGLYDVGKMKLFITNGTGIWNGFPVRLMCPAEIAVLTLKKIRH